jgi:hypothetical protein
MSLIRMSQNIYERNIHNLLRDGSEKRFSLLVSNTIFNRFMIWFTIEFVSVLNCKNIAVHKTLETVELTNLGLGSGFTDLALR